MRWLNGKPTYFSALWILRQLDWKREPRTRL